MAPAAPQTDPLGSLNCVLALIDKLKPVTDRDLNTIKDILGHSQISLTMNTYAHVLPAMKREAVRKMDELLSKAKLEADSQRKRPV